MGNPAALMVDRVGPRVRKTTAAVWTKKEKLLWIDRAYLKTELTADPREDQLAPLEPQHPHRAALEMFVKGIKQMKNAPIAPSKELGDALRALGYAE